MRLIVTIDCPEKAREIVKLMVIDAVLPINRAVAHTGVTVVEELKPKGKSRFKATV